MVILVPLAKLVDNFSVVSEIFGIEQDEQSAKLPQKISMEPICFQANEIDSSGKASVSSFQVLFLTTVGAVGEHVSCVVFAVLIHYSFLASFFWIQVMSFDIWRTFSRPEVTSSGGHRKRFLLYSAFGWVCPLVLVSVSITVDFVSELNKMYKPGYGDGLCWITQRRGLLIFFGAPLAVIMLTNLLFYMLTLRHLILLNQDTKLLQQQSQDKRHRLGLYVKLSVIMGLTWIFGFVATFADVDPLWYLFVVLNSLQGAFICLSFVMTRKVVKLLGERLRQWKTRRKEHTEESSRTKSTRMTSKSTDSQPHDLHDQTESQS